MIWFYFICIPIRVFFGQQLSGWDYLSLLLPSSIEELKKNVLDLDFIMFAHAVVDHAKFSDSKLLDQWLKKKKLDAYLHLVWNQIIC